MHCRKLIGAIRMTGALMMIVSVAERPMARDIPTGTKRLSIQAASGQMQPLIWERPVRYLIENDQ